MQSFLTCDLNVAEMVATRLVPTRPRAVTLHLGGGNSRIYRVETTDGHCYALKCYPSKDADGRDRLGTEWTALSFLGRHGVTEVPRTVAAAPDIGFALYEWIEGAPIIDPMEDDIEAALAFLTRLHGLRTAEDASRLPQASESCLCPAEVITQIDRRFARLRNVAADEPALAAFLEDEFFPARNRLETAARRGYAEHGLDFQEPIAQSGRSLSPSDFGFHNALRRPNGNVAFIDFEYFGWDAPVKLVADFLLHPGMALTQPIARTFRLGALGLYGDDKQFARHLGLAYPLYGLRWCMIILNEFLPERWQGRTFAGKHADRRTATRMQLAKARNRLTQILQEAIDR